MTSTKFTNTIELESIEENGASVRSDFPWQYAFGNYRCDYSDSDRSKYDVLVYDEVGNELQMSQLRYLGNDEVKGIYTAPNLANSELRVVIENNLEPSGEE